MNNTTSNNFVPTSKLRWIEREEPQEGIVALVKVRILQQWHAPDVQGFMRGNEGEWRDVECVSDHTPP